MRVEEIMTRNVQCCRGADDATVAARIMWDCDCGVVPVIDDRGRVIGMVTDRDLCMALYTRGCAMRELSIDSVRSKSAVCCRDTDSVLDAEQAMRDAKVRRLPVVDRTGKVVGILSLNDIARVRAASPVERAKGRALGDVAATLAAICEHRSHTAKPPRAQPEVGARA